MASAARVASAALLLGALWAPGAEAAACPRSSASASYLSKPDAKTKTVEFTSSVEAELFWVSDQGVERTIGELSKAVTSQDTFEGHLFRAYGGEDEQGEKLLLLEYRVKGDRKQRVKVEPCSAYDDWVARGSPRHSYESPGMLRAAEFEALIHDQNAPCRPAGRSSVWSCIRRLPADDCEARHKNDREQAGKDHFGFEAPQGGWPTGAFEDRKFDWQIAQIPRMSDGPGFLKMNMTKFARDLLLPWYRKEVDAGRMKPEPEVPGGYLNDKSRPVDLVELRGEIKTKLIEEMHQVLEWWSQGQKLRHTATFGARVYKRGSVLLNHVDRHDTHVVSGIMQVAQDLDEDGGWPVEVLSEDRDCFEVFLQPGEVLLYEGARFKHGRPMAMRGETFANIFTHFSPPGWGGAVQHPSEL